MGRVRWRCGVRGFVVRWWVVVNGDGDVSGLAFLVEPCTRRKEVHLHLQSPENSIRAAGVAPLLQTRDAHNLLDEMRKPTVLRCCCCALYMRSACACFLLKQSLAKTTSFWTKVF
ncbi:hypothetical protein L3X38_034132 [Prunus dulcis]|uniref:Uncharacterized protein n=1 Tax=Prunus dulcis TaxID=3755 RepID=A0AAD4YYA1_PRUDU|nr:hypothetical protein L3X38_034132 [Prunus dulcis]